VLRKGGIVLAVAGVVFFVVGFFWLATTGGSDCTGPNCHPKLWVLLPGSVLAFVCGAVMASLGGRGYGHTRGPTTFADVDSGAFAPGAHDEAATVRRPSRWSRSWRNVYLITGLSEIAFALMFAIAGIIAPEFRGTAILTGGLLALIGVPFLFVAYRAAAKDRLHETGIDGTARILGLTQTGVWMNNNPYVRLDLEVTVEGHPRYEIHHGEIVPQVLIGRLTKGTPLHIKVDPHHPSHIVVDWERG
jgi:hypothetical protein